MGKRSGTLCKTKAEAETLRDKLAGEFDKSPANRKRPEKITLGAFTAEFSELGIGPRGQRLQPGTRKQTLAALKRLSAFVGDDTLLANIVPADASKFVASLRKAEPKTRGGKKLSPASVNQIVRSLKSAFGVAERQLGYLHSSPFRLIRPDKMPDVEVRYVSVVEFTALLDAACNLNAERRDRLEARLETTDPANAEAIRDKISGIDAMRLWWETFVTVLYTAGLRLNEAANLTWADVDFEADTIRVIAKPDVGELAGWQPKGKRSRTIPVPVTTMDLLARRYAAATEGNRYVLIPSERVAYIREARAAGAWKEGQAVLNNTNRGWRRLTTAAEVDDATPHDLRRSAITNWARRLPIHTVMELAGHASMETTRRYYLAVTAEDLEAARKATEDAINIG